MGQKGRVVAGVGPKKADSLSTGNAHSCSGIPGNPGFPPLGKPISGIQTSTVLLNLSETKPDLCRECCYCSVTRAVRGLEEMPRSHLLFEVAPFLLVYQHQVEVIAHRELLIDIPHGGSELVACQEEPDRDGLSCKGQAGIRARDKVTTLPYTKSL